MSASAARVRLRLLERAGFFVAAFAYLLPFLDYDLFKVSGIHLVLLSIPALGQRTSLLLLLDFVAVVFISFFAAVAGLIYGWTRLRRRPLTGVLIGISGFVCLGLGFLWNPRPPFALGYYLAEAGFLLGLLASGLRLVSSHLTEAKTAEPIEDEVALSASQELLQRYR